MRLGNLAAVLLLASGCIDASQEEVSIPLSIAGRSEAVSFESGRGFAVTLEEAKLAFGPLYLCAGVNAGSFCEAALVEWTDAVLVDVLQDKPVRAGELQGLTGRARSFMYDLGLTSLLTEDRPLILDAARKLSGNSVRLSGQVEVQGITIPFRAAFTVQQVQETERGIPVVRSARGDAVAHELEPGDALNIRFDARAWFQSANFASWLEERTCEADGPETVCNGQIELSCAGETVTDTRDCADLNQVCIAGQGCAREVVVESNSQVASALRIGLMSASGRELRWSR